VTLVPRILGSTLILALVGVTPASAVELVYRPKLRDVARHKVMLAGRVSLTGAAPEATGLMDRRGEMTATIRYSATPMSRSDGATVVAVRMLDGQAVVKTDSLAETVDLGRFRATLTTDTRLETRETELEIEEDLAECSNEVHFVLDGFAILGGDWWDLVDVLYLPAGDVSPGAEWQYEDTEDLPSESAPPLVVKYRLLDLTTHRGRKCARIRASWRYEFSDVGMDENAGDAPVAAGNGVYTGDYLCYYDHERSVCMYSEGSAGLEISLEIPTPSGVGTASMKALVNVRTALE